MFPFLYHHGASDFGKYRFGYARVAGNAEIFDFSGHFQMCRTGIFYDFGDFSVQEGIQLAAMAQKTLDSLYKEG